MSTPRPRRLFRRVDCRESGLFVLLRDLPLRVAVQDWSEGGIGLLLPAAAPPIPTGQSLEARLMAGDRPLGAFDLLVRYVRREGAATRIGASIQPQQVHGLWRAAPDLQPRARPIAGEADVASFYRTLFRMPDGFAIRATGALGFLDLRVAPKGVLARPETFDLLCDQTAHLVGVAVGDAIDLQITALGAPYLVRTEVVAVGGDRLTLRLPGRLFSLTRRDSARVRCPPDLPCFLDVPHPLDAGRSLRFRVRDLSPAGLSLFPEGDLPIRPGPIRGRLVVPFRGEIAVELHAGGVRADADETVVAARITGLSQEGRRALSDYLLRTAFPDVHDRDRYDPWGVWEFLRACGYLPDGVDGEPARGWDLSRLAGPTLAHDVVRLHDGRIVGHLSCLRLYRRTWLIHQLAAAPPVQDVAAGAALVEYGATFLDTCAGDMDFMIAYYNQALPWHRMFFQGYQRRMADPDLAVIHPFRRYLVETTGIVLDRVRDRSVIEPLEEPDVEATVTFLRAAIPRTALLALDLDESALLGDETARAFAERGLEWKRVVFVQRSDDRIIGVAVCELASVGLNAFGITDLAKVVCAPLEPEHAMIARRALLARVKGFYLAQQRDRFFLLLDPSCSGEDLEAAGADFVETTGFVAFSREGLLDFRNFVRYELARISRLARRKSPGGYGLLGEPGRARTGGEGEESPP